MSPKKQPRSKTPRKTYFTITEAAKKLGISRAGVHEAIKVGRLEANKGEIIQIQVTKGWRIPTKALERYKVSLPHKQSGKRKPKKKS